MSKVEQFQEENNNEIEALKQAIKILNENLTEKSLILIQMGQEMLEMEESLIKYGTEGEEGLKRLKTKERLGDNYRKLNEEYLQEKSHLEELLNIQKIKNKERNILQDFDDSGRIN